MLNRLNRLDHEEAALRRRLLFRMLRDFNFDKPSFRSEVISDPIPRDLVGKDCEYFPPPKEHQPRRRELQRGLMGSSY